MKDRHRHRTAGHRMRRAATPAPAADSRLNGTYTFTATVKAFEAVGIHDQASSTSTPATTGDHEGREATKKQHYVSGPRAGEKESDTITYTLEGDTLTLPLVHPAARTSRPWSPCYRTAPYSSATGSRACQNPSSCCRTRWSCDTGNALGREAPTALDIAEEQPLNACDCRQTVPHLFPRFTVTVRQTKPQRGNT